MTSTINASTTAGIVTTADTSGVLALQTAGTTALSISAAQVVTLTNALPVASGGSGVTTSTGTGANVLGTTPSFTSTIGVGGATASASGSGISFPATQSASTDVNTLDDYEEGTWTPSWSGNVVAGSATYSQRSGTYTKIGNLVNVRFQTTTTSILTSGSGVLILIGLPFASTGTNQSGGSGSISYLGALGISVFTTNLYTDSGQTYLVPFYVNAAANGSYWTVSAIVNGATVSGSATYYTT